jgi:hypothetical protein
MTKLYRRIRISLCLLTAAAVPAFVTGQHVALMTSRRVVNSSIRQSHQAAGRSQGRAVQQEQESPGVGLADHVKGHTTKIKKIEEKIDYLEEAKLDKGRHTALSDNH